MRFANGHPAVVVAGGGIVGLTLALALRSAAPDLSVAVIDPAPAGAGSRDGRASAIAAAARKMLDRLGVWDEVSATAQPVTDMVITDSRTDDSVRPSFLTIGGDAAPGEPFAWMVPNGPLAAALRDAALAAGVELRAGTAVRDFETAGDAVRIAFADGRRSEARLLVAADGARSRLRALAGIRTLVHDYGQLALVVNVAHERPHHGRAEEHFLPGGPFAILPLKGNRSSLVWTEPKAEAERLMAADAPIFAEELARRFGHHLGALTPEGPRHAYPITLVMARDFVRPRFALCGDAAHAIHPVAGQGLNLGLRDAAALAETIVEAVRLGLDPGSLTALRRYERWRRADTVAMAAATDGLNRLFSNDNPLLRLVRDVGLGLVDRIPAVKRAMIGEAAGFSGELPRLLRGEAI